MLTALSIRDVVLVDVLDLEVENGLTVLTGETGAGKSIILDALGLALGARGDSGLVRHGAAQASEAALTTAALEMRWRNGWSVGATFEGEFSSVTQSYAGKGVMRYTW